MAAAALKVSVDKLSFAPDNLLQPVQFSLNNVSVSSVFFKIKLNRPSRYKVKPASGMIEPGGEMTVNVRMNKDNTLTAQDLAASGDAVLVEFVAFDQQEVAAAQEIWKTLDRSRIMLIELVCFFGVLPQSAAVAPSMSSGSSATSLRDRQHVERATALGIEIARMTKEIHTLKMQSKQQAELPPPSPSVDAPPQPTAVHGRFSRARVIYVSALSLLFGLVLPLLLPPADQIAQYVSL